MEQGDHRVKRSNQPGTHALNPVLEHTAYTESQKPPPTWADTNFHVGLFFVVIHPHPKGRPQPSESSPIVLSGGRGQSFQGVDGVWV
jgi:hypothetical protein